jgi:predicted 2-oxoglutarate/Fe(II)-dependent dioxygenase YbiX
VTADYNSHENQEISVLTSKKARTRLKQILEVKEILQGKELQNWEEGKTKEGTKLEQKSNTYTHLQYEQQ